MMTTDLVCLLLLALWSIPLNHIPALARIGYSDIAWGMSNRETMPDVPPWVERADRAQRNHHDNLALIAVLILLAQATEQADEVTAIATIALLGLRVIHGVFYILGFPIIRSLAYAGTLIAMGCVVWRILS